MRSIFQILVGRRCENVACKLRKQVVSLDGAHCEGCNRPLAAVKEVQWRAVATATTAGVILLASSTYLASAYLHRRAAEREAALLVQSTVLFEKALPGAFGSDVEKIVRSVQDELHLSDRQKQLLLEAEGDRVARLPNRLTPELQHRLEKLVRDHHRGGAAADDQRELDRFTQDNRLSWPAVQAFESDLRRHLDSASRSLGQGHTLIGQKMYAEARRAFTHATESDPGNPLAWANLGAVDILLGQKDEARTCYGRALALDPGNWLAHYNLGLLAARSGDRESAFAHFSGALTSLPATATRERGEVVGGLLHEPGLDEFRRDPRFSDLLSGSSVNASSGSK